MNKALSKYTPELARKAMEAIAEGSNSVKEAREIGVSGMTLRNWLHKHHEEEYLRARQMRAEFYVEQLAEYEEKMLRGELSSNDYREIKDRIKWQAGMENKTLYGNTPMVQISNEITLGQALDQMDVIDGTAERGAEGEGTAP